MAVNQIQCPNCGGFDVELTNQSIGCLLLMLLGFCFYIVPGVIAFFVYRKKIDQGWEDFFAGNSSVTCKLCKFQFNVHQIPRYHM
jgi:hypothetical protein